jgi:hypothetical protein
MLKPAKSVFTAVLVAISITAIVGLDAPPAGALEPDNASDVVALSAATGKLGGPCENFGNAFAVIGPNGAEADPYTAPNGMVLVVTSFNWQGNGGVPSVAWPGVLSQAAVNILTDTGARSIIRSSAIAGANGYAGTTITFPTGIILKPTDGNPLCLFLQQLNEPLIGTAFLYGFLAKDK